MRTSRHMNQFITLATLGCVVTAVGAILLKAAGSLNESWSSTLGVAIASLALSGMMLSVLRTSSYLPADQEVQQVAREIRLARDMGLASNKSQLHFAFPPHWRTYKAGKEGWVLRPKGLGIPVSISVWATEQEPRFADTSFDGMIRNVRDLARHEGVTVKQDRIHSRDVAGQRGLEYVMVDGKGHETLGFFWTHERGDFQVLIDASGSEHLRVIRPAVDAFLDCCHMR